MNSFVTVEIVLTVVPGARRLCVVVRRPSDEWNRAINLPFDLRMDYLHRISNSELLRNQVRRVDVRLIDT